MLAPSDRVPSESRLSSVPVRDAGRHQFDGRSAGFRGPYPELRQQFLGLVPISDRAHNKSRGREAADTYTHPEQRNTVPLTLASTGRGEIVYSEYLGRIFCACL